MCASRRGARFLEIDQGLSWQPVKQGSARGCIPPPIVIVAVQKEEGMKGATKEVSGKEDEDLRQEGGHRPGIREA